jgi:hypothetical protein
MKKYFFCEFENKRILGLNSHIRPLFELNPVSSRQSYNSQQRIVRVETQIDIKKVCSIGIFWYESFYKFIKKHFHHVSFSKSHTQFVSLQYYHPYSFCLKNKIEKKECIAGFSLKAADKLYKDFKKDERKDNVVR